MKYRIKKARGYYHIVRSMQGCIWRYTIMARDMTTTSITYNPISKFAFMYVVRKTFNLWRPHPSRIPTFARRAEK